MAAFIGSSCTGCTVCVKTCPVSAICGERSSPHVIDAERCIECSACGRLCPSSAIEDPSGTKYKKITRVLWSKPAFELRACISCGGCSQVCPASCISMSAPTLPGGRGSLPTLAKPASCVSCAWCEKACPSSCISMREGAAR